MTTPVVVLALAALSVAACGGSRTPPPTQTLPATPPDNSATISGREHIGWTQAADSVAGFVFLLYVDGAREQLPQATCVLSAAGGFECDSPLPPLSNGRHTLQIAAAIPDGDSLVEGAKSASIVVTVNGAADMAASIRIGENRTATSTAIGATAHASAGDAAPAGSCGLTTWDQATALAWSTNGDLDLASVAIETARPLVWHNDLGPDGWRLESVVRRVTAAGSRVYLVATVGGSEPAVRVVRYRELNAVLGERAVVFQRRLPTTPVRAAAAFGPDNVLYITFRWAVPQSDPQPFVLGVDVDALQPDLGAGLDTRFLSRDAIATAWDAEGRLWIVEPATTGQYSVRSSGSARASWTFGGDETPIGMAALTDREAPAFVVFAAQGDGWVLDRDGRITRTPFSQPTDRSQQATLMLGSAVISCRTSPGLALSYAVWRSKGVGRQ